MFRCRVAWSLSTRNCSCLLLNISKRPIRSLYPVKTGQHMLVHGPSNKLYYAFGKDNQVAVIDTLADKIVKTIAVKGGPTDVVFNMGWEAW